jgi:hypothetical protein
LDLKIADLAQDGQILQLARSSAQAILNEDPNLSSQENQLLIESATVSRQNKVVLGVKLDNLFILKKSVIFDIAKTLKMKTLVFIYIFIFACLFKVHATTTATKGATTT